MGCAPSKDRTSVGHTLSIEGGHSGPRHPKAVISDFNKNVEKGIPGAICPDEKGKSINADFDKKETKDGAPSSLNEDGTTDKKSGDKTSSSLDTRERSDVVKKLMRGDLSINFPSTLKTVRIFVSSTFTDTQHERNWLMEKVYPRLKEYCQSQGYDFQVVDMRWGIRDVAQDDHSTTEICLQEVDLCKTQSTGPCFLSLMSHKYGYRDFPRKIPADDFLKLVDNIDDSDVKQELLQWFMKDENDVPSTFILQPISFKFPDSISDDPEIRREALSQWNTVKSKMHTALAVAASKVLNEKTAEIYKRSVSEAEIMTCLPYAPKDNVLWYRRIIQDIDEIDANAEGNTLRRFKDFTNDPLKDSEAKELLKLLQENKMKTQMKDSNIKEYTVQWEPGKGIDPDKNESHRQYLTELCTDAEKHMRQLLRSAFNQQEYASTVNPVYEEVVQHTVFCQNKCKVFHGRNESLKKLKEYLKGPSNSPYVVHGPSGCGKTSLMAMTVDLANAAFGENVTTVFRFLGTTPESSNLPSLLMSLIIQMRFAAGAKVQEISNLTVTELTSEFLAMLKSSRNQPLVVVLDSLDQLDPSYEAHQLQWLTTHLGKNIKVILSTLPEEQYGILPILQDKLKEQPSNLLGVPNLSDADTVDILDNWLKSAGRKLTTFQRSYVIKSFHQCPLPLFLKLSFDQACQWKSYQHQDMTVLQSTVKGCIHELFRKMEVSHGKIFVSNTLGYLTASQTGLSEAELEDILSCDEEVLDDVYRFWTPPLRRLPPFLLIRMKRDLGQYVVHRGIDGKQVFNWYHRQFIETSYERYCSDSTVVKHLHQGLADFFAGSWANGKSKPYMDKNKTQCSANRHVAPQPIAFGYEFNERRLNRQAYHRAMAGQVELLKSECLMNYKFVTSKLKCSGLRGLLDDFRLAKSLFPNDMEFVVVSEALQLSQHALTYDLETFPSQMLGRINSSEIRNSTAVSNFLAECQDADHVYLQPDRPILTPIGGQLVCTIAEQSSRIQRLLLNKSGTVAVIFTEDGFLKTYDVHEGKALKSVDGVGKLKAELKFACSDSLIVINSLDAITVFDVVKVCQKWTLKTEAPSHFVIGGENDSVVIVFCERKYGFFMAETGVPIGKMETLPDSVPSTLSFSEKGPSVGHETWAVICDSGQDYAFLFEIQSRAFVKFDQIFKFDTHLEENEKIPCKLEVMIISPDGEILYIAEDYDEKIYCIHTQTFETFKAFDACKPNQLQSFHMSTDGRFIYFPNYNSVRVWDLSTGKKASLFNHLTGNSNDIEEVLSANMNVFVTTYYDRTMRIFDISRGDKPGLIFEDSDSDEFQMNEVNVMTCQQTDHSHLYIAVWEVGEWSRREQILALFDASKATILKRYHYSFEDHLDGKMTRVMYMKDWQVMIQTKRRVRILDLQSMKMKTTLEAVLPYYCCDVVPVNDGTEMALVSKEDNNIKIMDCTTGEVKDVLNKKEADRVFSLITNKDGKILVASCEGPFLVFDITKRTTSFVIQTSETHCFENKYYLYDSCITFDDTYLIFLAEHGLRRGRQKIASIHVYNLKNRIHEQELMDPALNETYRSKAMRQRYRSFKLLDETRIICTHGDFVLRIFNFQTGSLLHSLKGHNSIVNISYKMGSQYLLTHGERSKENAIRLWDTTHFQCFAVYSSDNNMKELQFIETGSCKVLAFINTEMQPVLFSLQGQGSEKFNVTSASQISNEEFPEFEKDGDEDLNIFHSHHYDSLDDDDSASIASGYYDSDMDDMRSVSRF